MTRSLSGAFDEGVMDRMLAIELLVGAAGTPGPEAQLRAG